MMGSPCFRDEVVYFLLHGDDELGAVGGLRLPSQFLLCRRCSIQS